MASPAAAAPAPPAPAQPDKPAGAAEAPKKESPKEPTSYAVFEAPKDKLKPGDTLTFLGSVKAENRDGARWAAVDADKGDLAKRVEVEEGKPGGVYLLAIAERNANPELTREEITQQKVRK